MFKWVKNLFSSNLEDDQELQVVRFKDGAYGLRLNSQVDTFYSKEQRRWFTQIQQIMYYCKMTQRQATKLKKDLMTVTEFEILPQ